MIRPEIVRQQAVPVGAGPDLSTRVITGVARLARAGVLPPFARSLGLSRRQWQQMQEHCGPDAVAMAWVAVERRTIPRTLHDLVGLFMKHAAVADERRNLWLAHAIAAAAHGERHLWQDLSLTGREEVSALLETHFASLAARNRQALKWKHFLFAELGAATGQAPLEPPGCRQCDQLLLCFPHRVSKDGLKS